MLAKGGILTLVDKKQAGTLPWLYCVGACGLNSACAGPLYNSQCSELRGWAVPWKRTLEALSQVQQALMTSQQALLWCLGMHSITEVHALLVGPEVHLFPLCPV